MRVVVPFIQLSKSNEKPSLGGLPWRHSGHSVLCPYAEKAGDSGRFVPQSRPGRPDTTHPDARSAQRPRLTFDELG